MAYLNQLSWALRALLMEPEIKDNVQDLAFIQICS
jgi:hypothetical protein